MTSSLDDLLDGGESLIGQIEDAKESVETELKNLAHATDEIDGALSQLTEEANRLHRQIADIRKAPPTYDPVALATTEAIDNLIKLLTEAKQYFTIGNSLAAYGTLVMFDEHADNLRAAVRLCKMAQRRAK